MRLAALLVLASLLGGSAFAAAPPQLKPAEVCGDGIAQKKEGCDDGNLVDGDGCSAKCTVEVSQLRRRRQKLT